MKRIASSAVAVRDSTLLGALGSVDGVTTARTDKAVTVHGAGPRMAARVHDKLSRWRIS
jgi:hypothetical protein